MRKYSIRLLLRLLRWLGHSPYDLSGDTMAAARYATDEAEKKGGARSGEAKRAQALRMMMNLVPDASHREIALAIELCLPQ